MDAAEADFDAKLYKASGDIIPELQFKLPLLIWHEGDRQRLRTHVLYTKCEELRILLDRFQEWPQLLDPVLAPMVQCVVDAFLSYITTVPETYGYQPDESKAQVIPLPLALSRLLYTFCKVRGYKVIVRLLSNEPRYVEPMLSAFRQWETFRARSASVSAVWEEKYIVLLWLSHLMLAPFELSTLSTFNRPVLSQDLGVISQGLPDVAVDVLSLGFQNVSSPSKERESAVILLVRLALRRDMQSLGLAEKLVKHAVKKLTEPPEERSASVYPAIGQLSLLYALMNLGTDSEVAPFLATVFQASNLLATSPLEHHASVRGSAPARKLLAKITRVCLTHAIALKNNVPDLNDDSVNAMLEDGIQNYLDALGDMDTPVRMSASKALSIVALKLNNDMAAEIVEAVLASLSENILLEDTATTRLIAKTERPEEDTSGMRRNVSAVDPLRWHGLMLTLGHLLFRRSPPPHLLADIIEALLLGLEFEQRSNVGTSVGNGVRDAACFGIWALSRKYGTQELETIKIGHIAGTAVDIFEASQSALQLISVRLMLSACFDPSSNIRRGSSAALQELIGRHPDTIIEGIPVVQAVDYQAVARRSRAMTSVAIDAAALDMIYHEALLRALLDWRGAKAADPDSRRWTSIAMAKLNTTTSASQKEGLLRQMLKSLTALKPRNLGATAGARHGLLLSMAAIIDSVPDFGSPDYQRVKAMLTTIHLSIVTGNLEGRTTNDMELVIEAIGKFIDALARSVLSEPVNADSSPTTQEMLGILNHCILVCIKPQTVKTCAPAVSSLFEKLATGNRKSLLSSWLETDTQKRSEMVCKGRLTSLAQVHSLADNVPREQKSIVEFFVDVVAGSDAIETRTTAMNCLSTLIERCTVMQFESLDFPILGKALVAGLNDYTNDQRGDIGSLLRLASIDAVEVLCNRPGHPARLQMLQKLIPYITRLAAEKLNKVRHRAWSCLQLGWSTLGLKPELDGSSAHLADISSLGYFQALVPLLKNADVQRQLVLGLASSAAGTTEEIGRSCCSALAAFIMQHSKEAQQRLCREVFLSVLAILKDGTSKADHETIPMLDFLAFLIEQDFISLNALHDGDAGMLWDVVQQVHTPTASMERVEALMRVYRVILVFPQLRTKALDKLTRQLLHRYPKIRNAAADSLYLESSDSQLVKADWNAAAATNKPVVLELRKSFGVAKPAQKAVVSSN
ncbi:uncharacterized protein HMPREF1541_04094 [Cyphellophora europaea CBS 101466]|uniref:Uncharacterized protein n=1 Tax=Cyphellophora europaea (strain CBS 101466) TaxID=1220924 RepID=W2S278_CYPE1|nr:uncharacterized protein HMPREF1541_04094 [Cyphellophora europaea CBS 101466]ETN42153.1 hypothetical protein HMPREF1541_04094 [Cyphellophora europaea CBS 101466]